MLSVRRPGESEGINMSRKQTKREIEQLKDQLKATNKKSDFRLLKMALVMVVLAVIFAFMHGRLQLW